MVEGKYSYQEGREMGVTARGPVIMERPKWYWKFFYLFFFCTDQTIGPPIKHPQPEPHTDCEGKSTDNIHD